MCCSFTCILHCYRAVQLCLQKLNLMNNNQKQNNVTEKVQQVQRKEGM